MNKKKMIVINILTVLALYIVLRAIYAAVPNSLIQWILSLPFKLALQYTLVLCFAANKTPFSKPLFDNGIKPFKRYYIDKLIILLALEYVFDQIYSLYVTIAFLFMPLSNGINETVYLLLILVEIIVDYLVIAKKDDSMKKSPKHFVLALSIGAVMTAVSAILYNALYQPLDLTLETANLSTYVNMLSYRSIADNIPGVLNFALACVFMIFHTLSLKSESLCENECIEN